MFIEATSKQTNIMTKICKVKINYKLSQINKFSVTNQILKIPYLKITYRNG